MSRRKNTHALKALQNVEELVHGRFFMSYTEENGRRKEAVQCSDLSSKASLRRLFSGYTLTLKHESVGSKKD